MMNLSLVYMCVYVHVVDNKWEQYSYQLRSWNSESNARKDAHAPSCTKQQDNISYFLPLVQCRVT